MISVIMASYLGEYPGCATNRTHKFKRAINSFLKQNIGELIIVSDGCEKTNKIVNKFYNVPSIKLVSIPKQCLFSGKVREAGISIAQHEWICYLDSDDEFKEGHLQTLIDNFDNNVDWMYYDDYFSNGYKREAFVRFGSIGTPHICHKKRVNNAIWPDKYNHDWYFIEQLGKNYKKIDGTGYIMHHIPNRFDT